MQKDRNKLILLVVICALCLYILVPIPGKPLEEWIQKRFKINPGIDLAGGAEVIYKVYDPENPNKPISRDETQKVVEILRRRIDRTGLKEPVINVQGDERVQIQIAGIDKEEWSEYKNIVEATGVMEWKEVVDVKTNQRLYEQIQNDAAAVPEGFQRIDNPYYRAGGEAEDSYKYILLVKEPIVTGKDVQNAYSSYSGLGRGWAVEFVLGGLSVKKFAEATKRLAGKGKIAIILDGKIISKPHVNQEISGGSGEITGSFTQKEAQEMAIFLTTGSLPLMIGRYDPATKTHIPKKPEMETIVGPTLGQDSIQKGIIAIISSFILIALFMIAYYKVFGIIAVATLALNVLFLMTILAVLGATLTLPGIAGIALTVGMAVDANILIFERIREEKEKNKTITQAAEHGHNKAFTAIFDSNITTLFVSIILYLFGTGTIRGFATTLFIGVITTLISAVYCGKILIRNYVFNKPDFNLNFMKFLSNPSFDFVKYLKYGATLSGCFILGSLVLLGTRLNKSLGFDFTGGSVVTIQLKESAEIDELRNKLMELKGADGLPKYSDVQIQIVADAQEGLSDVTSLARTSSKRFQIRTGGELDALKQDMLQLFGSRMTPLPLEDTPPETKYVLDKEAGRAVVMRMEPAGFDFVKFEQLMLGQARNLLSMNQNIDPAEPYLKLVKGQESQDFVTVKALLIKEDVESGKLNDFKKLIHQLNAEGRIRLVQSPFLMENNIGPVVAKEMRNSTIWALLISWIVIIIYLWIRFFSAKSGIAAVIALIHDALLSVAFVVFLGAVVPKSFGLNFDITLSTVAAILTIIGYSVNDTIVIFDRIRENLRLLPKSTFADIINMSMNQTLARTITTSLATWLAVMCMFIFTMRESGGIWTLSLPLVFGLIVGSYSTIFIASPLVYYLNKGRRPAIK